MVEITLWQTLFVQRLRQETRFQQIILVWVNTIKEGRFDDTNKMFVKPEKFDCQVTTQDAKHWAPIILKEIK